jgi:hypothetical protein
LKGVQEDALMVEESLPGFADRIVAAGTFFLEPELALFQPAFSVNFSAFFLTGV